MSHNQPALLHYLKKFKGKKVSLYADIETFSCNKLEDRLMLHIISKNDKIILSIERSDNTEEYCINLADETEKSQFLNDKYYKQSFIKKHEKGMFLYKDSFSKSYMERDTMLMQLNLFKLIPSSKEITTEETYQKIKQNNFLKALAKKYE